MNYYKTVRNLPVARFWYKGHHTHHVRRTVLVIKTTRNLIVGYELREGNEVRSIHESPVKSYRKNKIAVRRQLRLDNPLRKDSSASTLKREGLKTLVFDGI